MKALKSSEADSQLASLVEDGVPPSPLVRGIKLVLFAAALVLLLFLAIQQLRSR